MTTRHLTTFLLAFSAALGLASLELRGQQASATETYSQTFRGSRSRDVEYQKIAPFKVFDNLYHVGPGTVSVWLIPTTDGLILIDSAQEPYVDHILNNIRNVGFDPKDIKYILLDPGSPRSLRRRRTDPGALRRTRRVGGERLGHDGRIRATAAADGSAVPSHGDRDIVLKDGDTITLGSTSMKVYVTARPHARWRIVRIHRVRQRACRTRRSCSAGPSRATASTGPRTSWRASTGSRRSRTCQSGCSCTAGSGCPRIPNGGTFERAAQLQLRRGDAPHPFVDRRRGAAGWIA